MFRKISLTLCKVDPDNLDSLTPAKTDQTASKNQSTLDSKSFYDKEKASNGNVVGHSKILGNFPEGSIALKAGSSFGDQTKGPKDNIRDFDKINQLINGNDLSDLKKNTPQKRPQGPFFPQDNLQLQTTQSLQSKSNALSSTKVNSDRPVMSPLIKVTGQNSSVLRREPSTDALLGHYTPMGTNLTKKTTGNVAWGGETSKDLKGKPPLPSSNKDDHDNSLHYKAPVNVFEPLGKITINSRKNSDHLDSSLMAGASKEESKEPNNPISLKKNVSFRPAVDDQTVLRGAVVHRDHSRPPQEFKPITITSQDRSRSQNITRKDNSREFSNLTNLAKDTPLSKQPLANLGVAVSGSFSKLPDSAPKSNNEERYSVTASGTRQLNNSVSRGTFLPSYLNEQKTSTQITLQSTAKKAEDAIYTPHGLFMAKKMSTEGRESPEGRGVFQMNSPALNKVLDRPLNPGYGPPDIQKTQGNNSQFIQDLRNSKELVPGRSPYADIQNNSVSETSIQKIGGQTGQRTEITSTAVKITPSIGNTQPGVFTMGLPHQGTQSRDSYYGRSDNSNLSINIKGKTTTTGTVLNQPQATIPSYGGGLSNSGPQQLSTSIDSGLGKVVISSKGAQSSPAQLPYSHTSNFPGQVKFQGPISSPGYLPSNPFGPTHPGTTQLASTVIHSKRQ